MRISVLIATFNRSALLDECLAWLGRQRFEPGDEVIVVDNGSTDSTPSVIQRHARTFPVPLRTLDEPRPGKSIAIARALAAASGEVFAFTDDDVNVGARWLQELRATMGSEVALVGGRVLPRWERQPPRWLAENGPRGRLASPVAVADYGPLPIELGDRTAMGCNMAVHRTVIDRLGGFAPDLGSIRGTLLTGEDHEFTRRVQAAGLRAMYQPSAVVYHWVPFSRMRIRYFLRWFFWSGVTEVVLERTIPSFYAVSPARRNLPREFVSGIVRGGIDFLARRQADAALHLMDASCALGRMLQHGRDWWNGAGGQAKEQPRPAEYLVSDIGRQ